DGLHGRGDGRLRGPLHGHREAPLPPLLAAARARVRLVAHGGRASGPRRDPTRARRGLPAGGRATRPRQRPRPHAPPLRGTINLSSSADTLLRDRVLALRAKGVDNRVVCTDGPYVRPLRSAGIPVATLPIPRRMNPFLLAWSLVGLWIHLRRVKPDLVHTHC